MDKTTKQLQNVLCRQLQDIIEKVSSEFKDIHGKIAEVMESRHPSSGPNQQSWSGRKRTHSKLKLDGDDMQNDTSNTNLKITKMDDVDAADPPKAIATALGPVGGGLVPLPGQIQSGLRNPQILMPGQNNIINTNVA